MKILSRKKKERPSKDRYEADPNDPLANLTLLEYLRLVLTKLDTIEKKVEEFGIDRRLLKKK